MTIDECTHIIRGCLIEHIDEYNLTSDEKNIVLRVCTCVTELAENIAELKEWCER